MTITGNTANGQPIAPPIKVGDSHLVFEASKPRDNSALIGMLSKYTNRTDLSTLISDRDAW